jgi:serine/threonine protein kinase/WD40 repeat protein
LNFLGHADRIKGLFTEAVDLPDGEVGAFLESRCGHFPADRIEVEALLRAHGRAGRFLDPSDGPAVSRVSEPLKERLRWLGLGERPGSVIDRYKLTAVLGEGGFGVVYRAEQTRPVRRSVALKVVKSGMESDAVMGRFELERQALASMDHPNIARLLDAGTTDQGRPYFVMELVDGVPITQRARGLAIQQRVELFIPVCGAVHHAHQKGILHRDLKPSNILVAAAAAAGGMAKVIDFGIAKAITSAGPGSGGLTEHRQLVGTPRYMSPEQSDFGGGQIDTRSDVYSLGAVLYEVLTGTAPPLTDSTDHPLDNRQDRFPVRALASAGVPQDLTWILRRATDPEQKRRYESAAAFGDDLRKYLAGLPVSAGPPGIPYQLRKFTGRHKTGVVLTAAGLLSLLVCLVALSVALVRVRASRDRVVIAERSREIAERDAISKLRDSYLLQARAGRRSGVPGQRIKSLAALAEAVKIRPGNDDIRDEVIAALAVPDAELVRSWSVPAGLGVIAITGVLDRYAAVDSGHRLHILRTDQSAVCAPVNPSEAAPDAAQFSPDGRFLVAEYKNRNPGLCIWDASTGKEVLRLPQSLPQNSFTGDGKFFVVQAGPNSVDVWDLASGKWAATLPAGGAVGQIVCDPRSDDIAIADRTAGLRLIRSTGAGPIRTLPTSIEEVASICWSPDGRRLAVSGSEPCRIEVIDRPTATVQMVMDGHLGTVTDVTFVDNGRMLLSSAWDGTSRIWDVAAGKPALTIRGGGAIFDDNRQDRFLLQTSPTTLEQWRLVPSPVCSSIFGLSQDAGVTDMAVSPDGTLLVATCETGIHTWSTATGRLVGNLIIPSARSVAFTGDRHVLVSTFEGFQRLDVADLTRQTEPPSKSFSLGNTAALALSRDGRSVVFGTPDGSIRVSAPDKFTEAVTIGKDENGSGRYAAISPDGAWAMTARRFDHAVNVWNVRERRLQTQLAVDGYPPETGRVAFSPDGSMAVTCDPTANYFWTVPGWTPLRKLPRNSNGGKVVFSHDGKLVAVTGSFNITELLDPATGNVLARLEPPFDKVPADLIFSADDSKLFVGGQNGMIVWNIHALRAELGRFGLDWTTTR